MVVVCCAVNALRTRVQGFDYGFHYRIERGLQGIYAFWLSGGACLYVGMTTDFHSRLSQHRTATHNSELQQYFAAFDGEILVSYIVLPGYSRAELRNMEARAIEKLRPFNNIA